MGRRVTKSATRVLASSSVSQARAMALNHHTLWGEMNARYIFMAGPCHAGVMGTLGTPNCPRLAQTA